MNQPPSPSNWAGPAGGAPGQRFEAPDWGPELGESLGRIIVAEVVRVTRQLACQLAILSTALVSLGVVCAILLAPDQNGMLGEVTDRAPVATMTATLVAVILSTCYAISRVSRETTDGTVATALLIVPARGRLLIARCAAQAVVGALTAGLAAAMATLVTAAWPGNNSGELGVFYAGLVTAAVVTGAVTGVMACLLSTALRHGVAALGALMIVGAAIPAGLVMAQDSLPAAAAELARNLAPVFPGPLTIRALTIPYTITVDSRPYSLADIAGLVVWCALLAGPALARFRREH